MWIKTGAHEFVFALRLEFEPGSQVVRIQSLDGRWVRIHGESAVLLRAAVETACLKPMVSTSLVG